MRPRGHGGRRRGRGVRWRRGWPGSSRCGGGRILRRRTARSRIDLHGIALSRIVLALRSRLPCGGVCRICHSPIGWHCVRIWIRPAVVWFLCRGIDYGHDTNLRRIGGRVGNALGHWQLVLVTGTAKVFMSHRCLNRRHGLRIQPNMQGVLPLGPHRPHLGMPRRLWSSHHCTGGQSQRCHDRSFAKPGSRPVILVLFVPLASHVGEEFRLGLLFRLRRRRWGWLPHRIGGLWRLGLGKHRSLVESQQFWFDRRRRRWRLCWGWCCGPGTLIQIPLQPSRLVGGRRRRRGPFLDDGSHRLQILQLIHFLGCRLFDGFLHLRFGIELGRRSRRGGLQKFTCAQDRLTGHAGRRG